MSESKGPERLRQVWLASVCTVAVLQVTLGLAGLAASMAGVEWPRETRIPDWQRAVEIVAFVAISAYLFFGTRRDQRVEHLATLFLLIATFFSHPPIRALAGLLPTSFETLVRIVQALPVDAFTPAVVWLFFRDFPHALRWPRMVRFVQVAIGSSVAAAVFLIAANIVISLSDDPGVMAVFDRSRAVSHYWTVVFGLTLPTLPVTFWRARYAPPDERRRLQMFAGGLALAGIVPVLYAVLPPLHPSIEAFFRQQVVENVLRPLNLLMILSLSAITAYAVAVQNVLDVRTVIRKAAQYALARLAVATLAGVPFAIVAVLVYQARNQPLAALFEGLQPLWLAGLLAVGFGVLRLRKRVMAGIDRLFFREEYDARAILADVAKRSREAPSTAELAHMLTSEINRALHLESIGLLIESPQGEEYLPVAGTARRLARSSAIVDLLSREHHPMRVDLDRAASPLQALSTEDRTWLADSAAEVLVPLAGTDDRITGLLCLGAKRSELPYSREDLLLLSAVGGSVGITLENRRLRESPRSRALVDSDERGASECASCGRLADPEADACSDCGRETRSCPLPQSLFGKFSLERRVGAGAMGVVYRALDVTLDRPVALKTLPATSPADSARLRREARAMATIVHPNLALIFGAETWRGTPILVMEYLAGGTLGNRIARGRLEVGEALELCGVLASVLDQVHSSGLLHRDVKPSNIGYTEDEVVKLLDFGLVRIARPGLSTHVDELAFAEGSSDSGLGGTPLYMSPEALAGQPPTPGFDLWSLGVVAFEALAGRHPFERDTAHATYHAIRTGSTPDLRETVPDCPAAVVDLFERVLSPEPSRRPRTARDLARWVRDAA